MNYVTMFLFFILLNSHVMAGKANYVNMGIIDDEYVQSMRSPKPISVSDIIKYTRQKYADDVDELDFSDNRITHVGASEILTLAEKLPHLKKISFYNNRIYDTRRDNKYQDFEDKLINILNKDEFEEIDLRMNGIANISWIRHMSSKIGNNISKINWEY